MWIWLSFHEIPWNWYFLRDQTRMTQKTSSLITRLWKTITILSSLNTDVFLSVWVPLNWHLWIMNLFGFVILIKSHVFTLMLMNHAQTLTVTWGWSSCNSGIEKIAQFKQKNVIIAFFLKKWAGVHAISEIMFFVWEEWLIIMGLLEIHLHDLWNQLITSGMMFRALHEGK